MGKIFLSIVTIAISVGVIGCSGKIGEAEKAAAAGDYKTAHQLIDQVLAAEPENAKAFYTKGKFYVDEGAIIRGYVYLSKASGMQISKDFMLAANDAKKKSDELAAECRARERVEFEPQQVDFDYKLNPAEQELYDRIAADSGYKDEGAKAPAAASLLKFSAESSSVNGLIDGGEWNGYLEIYDKYLGDSRLRKMIVLDPEQLAMIRKLVGWANIGKRYAYSQKMAADDAAYKAKEAGNAAKEKAAREKSAAQVAAEEEWTKKQGLFNGLWRLSGHALEARCLMGETPEAAPEPPPAPPAAPAKEKPGEGLSGEVEGGAH